MRTIARPRVNLKAGFRRMPVTKHVDLLNTQVDGIVAAQEARRLIHHPVDPSILALLVELDARLKVVAECLKGANEIATSADYQPPVEYLEVTK